MDTMQRKLGRGAARRWLTAASLVLAVVATAGCDGLLDVEDPENLTGEDLEQFSPSQATELTVNGIRDQFQETLDGWIRYSGLFGDEFILAGTFPTRTEIDERQINPNNGTYLAEVYEEIHNARLTADTGVVFLQENQGTDGFADIDAQVQEGIAVGQYVGGYMRMLLAEGMCASPIGGGPALQPDELAQRALAKFEAAAPTAGAAGLSELESAATVGQARAHLWLGNYEEARTTAAGVPEGFVYPAIYTTSSPTERNEVHAYTFGDLGTLPGDGDVIRWTVGGGDVPERHSERWPYFDQWVDLGFIDDSVPDLEPFNTNFPIPIHLQLKYPSGDADVDAASGVEADFIEAEAALRQGDAGTANAIVNQYRADHGLAPITLTGTSEADLRQFAQERARELWISGRRLGLMRRYLDDNVNLFPEKPGDDTCFPIPEQETQNNPNL